MKLLRLGDNKKVILQLALPVIAGLSVQMILSLIDTAIIGRLPDAKFALAALGIAFYATWAVISFFSSLSNSLKTFWLSLSTDFLPQSLQYTYPLITPDFCISYT